MTDYYVTRGGVHAGSDKRQHTNENCRLLEQSERAVRKLADHEEGWYEDCAECLGDWNRSHEGKPHYNALLKAAAENAAEDDA